MGRDARAELVDFLEKKAFEPVLRAKPESYPDNKKDRLQDVQRATTSERDRYRRYESAQKVYQMFHDDLTSEPAKKIDRELRELGLPTLHVIRGEFERLAEQVGVRG